MLYFRYRSKGMENIPEGLHHCAQSPELFDGLFVTSCCGPVKSGRPTSTQSPARKAPFVLFGQQEQCYCGGSQPKPEDPFKNWQVLRNQKPDYFSRRHPFGYGNVGQFKKDLAILSHELNIPFR